jgi:hypothetical protein
VLTIVAALAVGYYGDYYSAAALVVAGVGRIISTNNDPDVAAAGRLVEAVGTLGAGLRGYTPVALVLTASPGEAGAAGANIATVAVAAIETAEAVEGVAEEAGRGG